MSQCQGGVKDLKCYEWRHKGIKRRFRIPKHTKVHIKKDYNRCFVENFRKIVNLSENLYSNRLRYAEFSIR